MKSFKKSLFKFLVLILVGFTFLTCEEDDPLKGFDGIVLPPNHGILEVDFKLPVYGLIQDGIRRVDLAICNNIYELNRGEFFYHSNVSDAKQVYQIALPDFQ